MKLVVFNSSGSHYHLDVHQTSLRITLDDFPKDLSSPKLWELRTVLLGFEDGRLTD